MVIRFLIPGRPIPKSRPRFNRGKAHTPARTRAYQKFVALCGMQAMAQAGCTCTGEPVALVVTVLFDRPAKPPKDHPTTGIAQRVPLACAGGYPDLSNVVKAIEDGLEGIVYKNDSQLWQLQASKWWCAQGEAAGVEVVCYLKEGVPCMN